MIERVDGGRVGFGAVGVVVGLHEEGVGAGGDGGSGEGADVLTLAGADAAAGVVAALTP